MLQVDKYLIMSYQEAWEPQDAIAREKGIRFTPTDTEQTFHYDDNDNSNAGGEQRQVTSKSYQAQWGSGGGDSSDGKKKSKVVCCSLM